MLEMWGHFMNKRSGVHKQIKYLLKQNLEIDKILAEFPLSDGHYNIPEDGYKRMVEAGFLVAQTTKQLGQYFADKDIKVFNVTAKVHCMLHIILLSKWQHPALTWCYSGEDFMGILKTLLQSCTSGNNPFQAMNKATKHYNLGCQLKWDKDAKQ